jgi:sigma-B regulation protein RsbU (phosphoserine phosphatase)
MQDVHLSGPGGESADSPRQLQAVARIAYLLNSPLPLDDLLRELVTLAAQVVQAEAASLFRLDTSQNELVFDVVTGPKQEALTRKRLPVGLGVAGWVAQQRTVVAVPDVLTDARFYPAFDAELGFQTRNLLAVPMFRRGDLVGVLEVVNRKGETTFTAEDELVLTTFASQAAVAIDNARMQAELLEKVRLEQELAIAARMQADLLPKRMPALAGYDVAARMVPSETIGGDFYDFIPIAHDHVGITVADGAGKGIPGALLMALTRSALNVQVTTAYAVRDIIAKLNNHLATETAPHLFVTLFYGALDIPGRRLTYTNAGHPAGLLLRGEGCRRLETGGPLLGVIPGESYEEEQVRFLPGDLLALYSDGVTEAMDPAGGAFSENRLVTALRASAHLPSVQIVRRVHDEVTRFIGGRSFADDFTLLIVKVL